MYSDGSIKVVVCSLNAKLSRIITPNSLKDLKECASLPSQGNVVNRGWDSGDS